MITVKIDQAGLKQKLGRLEDIKKAVMPQAFSYFESITPIRSGNARRKTRLTSDFEIITNYPYAQRLDEGWSKQSPNGMSEPTVKKIRQLISSYLNKIGA